MKRATTADATQRQLSAEADRIARDDVKVPSPWTLIPRDEEIRPQPAAAYRPPPFLARTASPAQVEELTALLSRLREVNDEHAGEKTLEAQVYYAVTGLGRDLKEGFRRWCEEYFLARADPRHLNPQVRNDPFLLFEKRVGEMDDLLGGLSRREHTLNSMFLNLSLEFVPWLLYDRLWKGLVEFTPMGSDRVECRTVPPYRPVTPEILAAMAAWVDERGWYDDHLARCLRRLAGAVDPRHLAGIAPRPDERLRAELAAMARDIQEMRPLLVCGYKSRKTALALGVGLWASWAWCGRHGIANLSVGGDEATVVRLAETNRTARFVGVDADGLLFDSRTPWLTAADAKTPPGGPRPLALNHHVLGRFHERLFTFYDRIDLRRVRREGLVQTENGCPDEEAVVAALAASCRDLAEQEEPAPEGAETAQSGPSGRIRPLRSTRLLALLADRFGCEVRQGKGSEVTVYREGGRKFTLGHHGRCVEVRAAVLRRLLRRVGISPADWLHATCA